MIKKYIFSKNDPDILIGDTDPTARIVFGLIFFCFGFFPFSSALHVLAVNFISGIIVLLGSLLFFGMGLFFINGFDRTIIDRRQGKLIVQTGRYILLSIKEVPLGLLESVQLARGRFQGVKTTRSYFQVGLLKKNGDECVNFQNEKDRSKALKLAQAVSLFTNLPLVDKTT